MGFEIGTLKVKAKNLFRWSLITQIIFVLWLGSIIGLTYRGIGAWDITKLNPPKPTRQSIGGQFVSAEFSLDSRHIICAWLYWIEPSEKDDRIIVSCWDVVSGEKKWDSQELNGTSGSLMPVEGKFTMLFFVKYLGTNTTCVIDLDNGNISPYHQQVQVKERIMPPIYSLDGQNHVKFVFVNLEPILFLFRQRRPPIWYGIAWIPEIWLIGVLSIAIIFSIRRDWKDFRLHRIRAVQNALSDLAP